MNFQKIFVPVAGVAAVAAAYNTWGWQGVLLVLSGIVFWLLLHFNRMLSALKRAANRPIGYVDSAVMLNAKLQGGVTMLHVVSMTRALGKQLSPKDTQPEVFLWTDAGESSVTCEFEGGKLMRWKLDRPSAVPDAQTEAAAPPPAN
jgi:hypothetical protein